MSRWPDHRGGWPWPRPGLVGGPGPPFGPYYGGSWPGLPVQPQMLQSLSPAVSYMILWLKLFNFYS